MKRQDISIENISLLEAARQVLKNWSIVVCIALAVFLGTTGIGMLTYTPEYTASATLVVQVKGSDTYSTLSQTTQIAAVYSEVFQSSALRNIISQSIGESIEGTISCTQISSTNLLELSTTSPTPRQAYLFIDSALENYKQVTEYVFANVTLEIVQEPSVPETPSNTSFFVAYRTKLTVAAALGAAALIVLLYLLRNTVKVAARAASLLDGKVLGTVPYEKKQTTGDRRTNQKGGNPAQKQGKPALLLTSPLVSMNFAEATRRVATRLEAYLQHKQYQVLLVVSVEENEGKSTLAANIAIALAEYGKKVMLIDGDLRKPAQFKIFDRVGEKQPSFSDVVAGNFSWNEAAFRNEKGNFWEIFQCKALENPVATLNSQNLSEVMSELRAEMDYIIVDCSPVAAVADSELWMHYVDTVALVVRQDYVDVRIINDTVDLIWKSAGDFSGFILNAFRDTHLNAKHSSRYGEY